MTKLVEKLEETEKEPEQESLSCMDVIAIDGIGDKIASKLKKLGIKTLEDLMNCNPFVVGPKIKVPVHKIMEFKNKAFMVLQLRFDEKIVNALLEKGYSLQKAMEEDPKVLQKITGEDIDRVADFLDKLSQLSIYIDAEACRNQPVNVLRTAKITVEPPKPALPEEELRNRFRKVLENTEVALLLERMLEGYINELTPRWAITTELGFGYPEAEEIVNPNNEVTYKILQRLYDAGILKRYFFDKISRCPNCNYINLSLRYTCVRCGSRKLIRDEVIEHYDCAHVDLSRRFETPDGRLVCPKCHKELKQLGLDYSRPGVMYECRDCGDITGSPYQRLLCLNCGALIKKEESVLDDVWSFTLNHETKYLLIELLNPKRTILRLLADIGFNVEAGDQVEGRLRGKSGVLHYFDVYAERDSDRLLIEFVTDENQVEINAVYDLIAKARDLDANIVALLAFPVASPEAKKFAEYHNISLLEGENLANVIPLFEEQLNNIVNRRFKP